MEPSYFLLDSDCSSALAPTQSTGCVDGRVDCSQHD
jgi:hypothetical protein